MATAEATPSTANDRAEIQQPLARLRRAIHSYILIDGLAQVMIWSCLWCWLTFLLDWGLFQLFNLDYVRDGSQGVRNLWRAIFIPALVAGLCIIIYQVVARLVANLREPALALVLERRFPGILGDRLVTSVELADRNLAERYGYSWAMVERTQHSAAERLARLDVWQALNRRWLVKAGVLAILLIVALLALALFATDAAAVWFERDFLLMHRYWPRHTVIELVSFPHAVPHGGEARIEARAWKWVAATRTNAEGWRPLEWEDVLPGVGNDKKWDVRPFADREPAFQRAYWNALPKDWRDLTLDQVESRLQPQVVAKYRRELGLAVIRYLSEHDPRNENDEAKEVEPLVYPTLAENRAPPPPGEPPTPQVQVSHLELFRMAELLTAADVQRITELAEGKQLTSMDALLTANVLISPVKPPVWNAASLQRVTNSMPAFNLSDAEKKLLPANWLKALPAKAMGKSLRDFFAVYSSEAIGSNMAAQLRLMFQELDRRAEEKRIGSRRAFRHLFIPEEVTVEFEQVLSDEERLRAKPKVGTPRVRHAAEGYDYAYDFKKVERPLRFRVVAGDTYTHWEQIQVKPIPTLKRLTRTVDELGYLHGSNSRVQTGPIPVSLEGSESRFDVSAGTRLQLEGECYKDLRNLRAGAEAPPAPGAKPPSVTVRHERDGKTFQIDVGELTAGELRLRLDLEDTDGIPGRRDLVITIAADKPPEFQGIRFEVVNHKMITPQAVLPFSGLIHDDHGLRDVWFEAVVEKDQKVAVKKRLPMLHFQPFVPADPAAAAQRFEKWEDVTPARILGGPCGRLLLAQLGISRLPITGPATWLPPLVGDIPRNYAFQYRERTGNGVVLGPEDEYLDTRLLRPQPPAGTKPPEWLAPPYHLRVSIGARDNRIVTTAAGEPTPAGQESANPETFEFTVVDEAELLIEAGKREEDLRDRCEEIIGNLKKARTALARLKDDFPTLKDENEFRRAAADGQDMAKAVRAARDGIDQRVLREFRQIYRELALNRCREDVLVRIDQKICRPLEVILQTGQHFERADEALDALIRAIEMDKAKAPPGLFSTGIERTDRLIGRLEEILIEMKKLIEFNQALTVLRELIKGEELIIDKMKEKHRKSQKSELEGK